MNDTLSIGLIADIHYGSDKKSKLGSKAIELLQPIINQFNSLNLDLVIDLGDRINNCENEEDKRNLYAVANEFMNMHCPRVHMLGNHDVKNVEVLDQEKILMCNLNNYVIVINGWQLIFLNEDIYFKNDGFYFSQATLEFVKSVLLTTEMPCIVFSHLPFSSSSMVGNYYFEEKFSFAYEYKNANEMRAIIRQYGNVVAVVTAHVHWNSIVTIDGIHYLTVQSLTESFTTHPLPANSWAVLKLSKDILDFNVEGNDPFSVKVKLKKYRHHWSTPD